jgi:hypothetical protein
MPLTIGDLVQTGEEVVVLLGDQVREFGNMIDTLVPDSADHTRIRATLSGATRISGYKHQPKRPAQGVPIGWIAGRAWFAEKAACECPPP